MADPITSVIHAEPPPAFAAVSRLATPPPAGIVAAELEARSAPGDVVVDLHGRGGWIARAAIARLRSAYVFESSALTRLLAEVVLRPPDIRHFEAAVKAIAFQPRGQVGLHQALNDFYASRCATCQRAVVVEEFIWQGDPQRPARKVYRCVPCRDQIGGGEMRNEPTDDADAELSASITLPRSTRDSMIARFPVLDRRTDLAEQLLALYTPRNVIAIEALIERIERDLRAAPIEAALRLALLHVALPASRLNAYPGRVAQLRIADARIRTPLPKQWRECNPWHLFNEGCRLVRGFLQRLEAIPGGAVQARLGDDLLSLVDGSANAVLKRGSPALRTNAPEVPDASPLPGSLAGVVPAMVPGGAKAAHSASKASNVRLVLTQPPPRWTTENLSFAYLGTGLALGRDAAASLPLEAIFGPAPRTDWGWEAVALRRSLAAVAPVLAPDANIVVMLEPGGAEGLVAGALGGIGAGYRLRGALLAEEGEEVGGTLEFIPPPRPGARRGSPARGGGESGSGDQAPFQLAELQGAVSEVAVSILQERGEPARFERLLGEILVGLDRAGHLKRLVGTHTFTEGTPKPATSPEAVGLFGELPTSLRERGASAAEDAGPETSALDAARDAVEDAPAEGKSRPGRRRRRGHDEAAGDRAGDGAVDGAARSEPGERAGDLPSDALGAPGEASPDGNGAAGDGAAGDGAQSTRHGSDHVGLLLDMILKELHRADHPSIVELEPGRWWLKKREETATARLPLSDRVEWAVFSLLSTAGHLSEQAFFDRIAGMFRGHDTPDEALVRACLESYRSADSTSDALRTDDVLQARYDAHTELIGQLTAYGHRLGLRCWIGHHEQKRLYNGAPLGSLLSDAERRTYLPFVARGSVEALEATDCIWYLRGKATFLFEVEWTAMLGEPLLRRGPQIATDDHIVRFLVLLPERTELARFKMDRSPLLRQAVQLDNWHFLKANHLRTLAEDEEASLERFAPFLGLDPDAEILGEQLPLF
jgi:hypothetical protein